MAVAVTNNTLTAASINAVTDLATTLAANAATVDTDGGEEVFTFTPTKPESRCLMICRSSGTHDGNITATVGKGANAFDTGATKTLTIPKTTTSVVLLDGRYKSADGTFVVTFDPASTDKLKTDHAFTVAFIELP